MINTDELSMSKAMDYLSVEIKQHNVEQYQKEITLLSSRLYHPLKKDVHYNNRGCVYLALRYYTNAINDFTSSLLLNPLNALFYINRATVFLHIQDINRTIVDINFARELTVSDPTYLSLLLQLEKMLYKHLDSKSAANKLSETTLTTQTYKSTLFNHVKQPEKEDEKPKDFNLDVSQGMFTLFGQSLADGAITYESCLSIRGSKFVSMPHVSSEDFVYGKQRPSRRKGR